MTTPERTSPPRLNVTLPADLRDRVESARLPGESTAQAIRRLVHVGLAATKGAS